MDSLISQKCDWLGVTLCCLSVPFIFLSSVHRQDRSGEGGKIQVPWRTHHCQSEMVHPQRLFNLRRLKNFGMSPKTLKLVQMHNWEHPVGLYHRLVRQLQRPQPQGSPEGGAVFPTHHMGKLPALQVTYSTWSHKKAKKIIKGNNHPSHCLFTQLSSRRPGQYMFIKTGTQRLKNSFYLKAIKLLNSHH